MADHEMDKEDVDMAAAMGFSTFGGTKKRKHDETSSPKAKIDASGANSTQLGARPKKPVSEVQEAVQSLKTGSPVTTGLAQFLARGQSLPEKPPVVPEAESTFPSNEPSTTNTKLVSFGGPSISTAELNALRFGVRNAGGDNAYFLPNFIEDPWEVLNGEK
jgi:hypothetical protein